MSFQAYLDNIRAMTGKSPEDFRDLAAAEGLLGPGLTATRLVAWLGERFGLGRGHAMAVWAVFKEQGWVAAAPPRRKRGASAGTAR